MDLQEVIEIVTATIKDYALSKDKEIDMDTMTPLLGEGSIFDSVDLVAIIIEIESAFLIKGLPISLTSEKALSQKNTPFLNIQTLSYFISNYHE